MTKRVIPRIPAPLSAPAIDKGTGFTLREAALRSGDISPEDFDRIVDPRTMIGPSEATREAVPCAPPARPPLPTENPNQQRHNGSHVLDRGKR